MSQFKVGDRVLVKGGDSQDSGTMDGQICMVTKHSYNEVYNIDNLKNGVYGKELTLVSRNDWNGAKR